MGIYTVQSKTHLTSQSDTAVISTTLSKKPTLGNVMVAAIASYNGYGLDSSVDYISQYGVDWQMRKKSQSTNYYFVVEIWSGLVIDTNASCNITIHTSSVPSQDIITEVFEYNGIHPECDSENQTGKWTGCETGCEGTAKANGCGNYPCTTTENNNAWPSLSVDEYTHELFVGATFVYDNAQQKRASDSEFTFYDGLQNHHNNSLAYLENKIYASKSETVAFGECTTIVPPYNILDKTWYGCIVAFKANAMEPLDCNCTPLHLENVGWGNKGVTIWGAKEEYSIHLNAKNGNYKDHKIFSFTGTHPNGYGAKGSCNITWKIMLDNDSSQDAITVNQSVNWDYNSWRRPSGVLNDSLVYSRIHSKTKNHDIIETVDIAPISYYSDDGTVIVGSHPDQIDHPNESYTFTPNGVNTITFENPNDVGLTISGIRVVRVYALGSMDSSEGEIQRPRDGTLDWQREDFPCLNGYCDPHYSFTKFGSWQHNSAGGGDILPNSSKSWRFTNPPSTSPSNYDGIDNRCSCFFNFNNVQFSNDTQGDDIQYSVLLNDHLIETFYHGKNKHSIGQGASVDLTQYSDYYHPEPSATNKIALRNDDSTLTLRLRDGEDDNDPGRVDIYRVYKTRSICPTISVVQGAGGTISPNTISVPYNTSQIFKIQANSGYSIAHVYVTTSKGTSDLGSKNSPFYYNFTNVTSDCSITAAFSPPAESHQLTINALDSQNSNVSASIYLDNNLLGTANNSFSVAEGWYSMRVVSTSNVFHQICFGSYCFPEFQKPVLIGVFGDATYTANFYSNPAPQYTLHISAGQGGTTTDPSLGDYSYAPQIVTVTADPDEQNGYVFYYWLLDGVAHYEQPIEVKMTDDHDLETVFIYPTLCYVSEATYSGAVDDADNVVGEDNDDDYACIYGNSDPELTGTIIGTLNDEAEGNIWLYGYNDISKELSRFDVYVSATGQENDWEYVTRVEDQNFVPHWVNCGTSSSTFNYIKLVGYDAETKFWIDSIRVVSMNPKYDLTISSGDNGSTNPAAPYTCEHFINTTVTVEAYPDPGYILDYWLLDDESAGSNPRIDIYFNRNHTLQPVFREPNYYDLTIECGENGSTDPEAGTYEDIVERTQYGIIAYPDSGYQIDCWILDDNEEEPYSYEQSVTLLIDDNHTLEARFKEAEPPQCSLTLQAFEYPDTPVEVEAYIDSSYVGSTEVYQHNLDNGAGYYTVEVPQYDGNNWNIWYTTFDNEFLCNGLPQEPIYVPEGTHTITFIYITGK
jgi:hypothetical protein